MENPFAFALVVPTHHYPTLGHAASDAGSAFSPEKAWIVGYRESMFRANTNFAFVQEVQNVSHNRSNAELELGYFLNPKWNVRALGVWQHTHGGIDVPVPRTNPYYPNHGRLAAERYLQVGGGGGI